MNNLKITIRNKRKFRALQLKTRRFFLKRDWKVEKDIVQGDKVIVTDPQLTNFYHETLYVLGYSNRGDILCSRTRQYIAGKNIYLSMNQCQKYNPKVHDKEGLDLLRRLDLPFNKRLLN